MKPAIPVQSEISIGTRTIEKQRTIQEMTYAHTYTGYIDVYQNANSFSDDSTLTHPTSDTSSANIAVKGAIKATTVRAQTISYVSENLTLPRDLHPPEKKP